MAIQAYDGVTPVWYTPDSEKDAVDAAEFHLFPLTGPQLLEVQQFFDTDNSVVLGPGLVMSCKYGMRGWKNIVDGEGNEMVFTRNGLNRLPAEVIAELGGKIIGMSVIEEEEVGNSLSQSK